MPVGKFGADVNGTPSRVARRGSRSDVLLGSALQLIAERGFIPTTMEDIGNAAGIKGPSVYKHYESKEQILFVIMRSTMESLLHEHKIALASAVGAVERFRRAVECHVRFHTRHREEAFVGNREIRNLTGENFANVLGLRQEYELSMRSLVLEGAKEGVFNVRSPRLVTFAILDMGIGISSWFRADGRISESEIVYEYGDYALAMVGLGKQPQQG